MGLLLSKISSFFYNFSNKSPIIFFRSIDNQKWEDACLILQNRKLKNKKIDYKELIYVSYKNNNERWEYYIITNQNSCWVLQTEYINLKCVMIFINGFYNPITNNINWIL